MGLLSFLLSHLSGRHIYEGVHCESRMIGSVRETHEYEVRMFPVTWGEARPARIPQRAMPYHVIAVEAWPEESP